MSPASIEDSSSFVVVKAFGGVHFAAPCDSNVNYYNALKVYGITHLLYISEGPCPQKDEHSAEAVAFKQIIVDGEPMSNVLHTVDEATKWIEHALDPSQQTRHRVLIQSQSNTTLFLSHAILVAFIMRHMRTSYSEALYLARQSVCDLLITDEAERQLRIWGYCQYNIYRREVVTRPTIDVTANMPGTYPLSPVLSPSLSVADKRAADKESGEGSDHSKYKPAYLAWQKEREARTTAKRLSSLAERVALLAKERLLKEEQETEIQVQTPLRGSPQKVSKKQQWAKIKQMEQNWNEKMIRGAIPA